MFTMRYRKFICLMAAMEILSCALASIFLCVTTPSATDVLGIVVLASLLLFGALTLFRMYFSKAVRYGGFLPLLYYFPAFFLLIVLSEPHEAGSPAAAWDKPMGDELGTLWYHLVGAIFLVLSTIILLLWIVRNRIRQIRYEERIQGASVFWKIIVQTTVVCSFLSFLTIEASKELLNDYVPDNVASLLGLVVTFIAVSSILFLIYRDPDDERIRREREEKARCEEEKRLEKERLEEEKRLRIVAEKEAKEVHKTLRKAFEDFVVKQYKDRPQEQRNVAYYFAGMNSNLDDDKYLAYVNSKISKSDVQVMALKACGLDQKQISEITPVKFEGFNFDETVLCKPLKDGRWISSSYQVTYIFFTDETLRLFEARFDLTTDDDPAEKTYAIPLRSIVTLGSINEPMQLTTHGVTERIRYQGVKLVLSSGDNISLPIDNEKQRDAVLAKWLEIQNKFHR